MSFDTGSGGVGSKNVPNKLAVDVDAWWRGRERERERERGRGDGVALDEDCAALLVGGCREVLKQFPENTFDAVVTDPPYEISFMGRKWDNTGVAFAKETWAEVLRVLKPGGYLIAFSGTRTSHRMVCAIEDAGFEVRDSISWIYGTGFPKSLNLPGGLGTALKPALEPACLARKPLEGTVAENWKRWGTGVLNIDACLVTSGDGPMARTRSTGIKVSENVAMSGGNYARAAAAAAGRWPANVILDEEAGALLDAQTSALKQGGRLTGNEPGSRDGQVALGKLGARGAWEPYMDSGGASRFFYCAKASRSEREEGCEGLPVKTAGEVVDREEGSVGIQNPRAGAGRTAREIRNGHPTVKPVALMRYLCRLVTPPGGVVLDPFTGSGSTGVAAMREGFSFVGCEMSEEYAAIAEARIRHAIRNKEESGASEKEG